MKICSQCKIEKSIENFGVCKAAKDGLRYQCKDCRKQQIKYAMENKKNYKYSVALRNVCIYTLRHLGIEKYGKSSDILKYTSKELKRHIESLWLPEMSWENYGEWQIDHIKAISTFDNNTPPHIISALENLRPIWKTTRIINNITYFGNLNKGSANFVGKDICTIICDIDGTLIEHNGSLSDQLTNIQPKILDGTLKKFDEWDRKGFRIILITGRKESSREYTIKQLKELGIFYDQLIMGVGPGKRILINDYKAEDMEYTAFAINVPRNQGIQEVDI